MTFLCVIAGCNWVGEGHAHMGNEYLRCQHCSRCGSFRYLFDEKLRSDMLGNTMAMLGNGT
nr:PSPA7_2676 family Cys-rich small protein [uncultured Pseudomonas sp.]